MRFAAIDFETATGARDSACALGLCIVDDSVVVEQRAWLIRPPDNHYSSFNTAIHGLGPHDTANAPCFEDVYSEVWPLVSGLPLVAHNAAFDMSVFRYGLDRAGLAYPDADYYCTLLMSRSHWPGLPGYSLPIVLARCGLSHQHHLAEADAWAAANVLLEIARGTGRSTLEAVAASTHVTAGRVKDWWYRPCSGGGPCAPREQGLRVSSIEVADDADPDHPFYDADVAFTGTLVSMTREEAMQKVGERGGRPRTSVSRRTEYLVVGSVEYRSVLTGEPSGKMKKALQLRSDGCPLIVLSEQEFLEYL